MVTKQRAKKKRKAKLEKNIRKIIIYYIFIDSVVLSLFSTAIMMAFVLRYLRYGMRLSVSLKLFLIKCSYSVDSFSILALLLANIGLIRKW